MTHPRRVYVEVPVHDPDDALRIVRVLQTVTTALWDVFGEQLSERLVDQHLAGQLELPLPDDLDLPF